MAYQPTTNFPCLLCGKPSVSRKLCRPCYCKMSSAKRLNEFPKLGPADVFFGRIKKTESCWLWCGTTNYYGYGVLLMPGEKPVRAHRYSYELHKGKIPESMVILHSCDNPLCVNPDHLSVGTRLDNNRDAVKKRRNAFGDKNGRSKLSKHQVNCIRSDNRPQHVIATEYGVTQSHVSRIKSMDVRRHD